MTTLDRLAEALEHVFGRDGEREREKARSERERTDQWRQLDELEARLRLLRREAELRQREEEE